MEEQQREQAPPVRPEKKVTLQDLEEVNLFQKWTINLRILLEPISILRYVVILLCMLAFSLTAGFNPSTTSSSAMCTGFNGTSNISNATVSVGYSYPYRPRSYDFVYNPSALGEVADNCTTVADDGRMLFAGSAQYFVFMSVVQFLYGILIVVFYVFFYTKKLDIYKYAAVVDLIVTILMVFFFLLACIAWSAGNRQLGTFVTDLLSDRSEDCLRCVDAVTTSTPSHAQVSISLLFGWCACFVLLATLWFIYKDTIFHLEKMGPLYRLSFYKLKKGGGEAEDQSSDAKAE